MTYKVNIFFEHEEPMQNQTRSFHHGDEREKRAVQRMLEGWSDIIVVRLRDLICSCAEDFA